MRSHWILFAALLGGCSANSGGLQTAGAPDVRSTTYKLTQAEIALIENGVRRSLKDPESATFRDIAAAADEKGHVTACGMVNAKNSYGGYTGFQPFTGFIAGKPENRGFLPGAVGGSALEMRVTVEMCRKYGVPLLP